MIKHCQWCEVRFETNRRDKRFCTTACRAAHQRAKGRTGAHAGKHRNINKNCQWCGRTFDLNEYGNRSGARQPRFCSAKCRTASWRASKGKGTFGSPPKAEKKRVEFEKPPKSTKRTSDDFRDRLSVPRRWDAANALRWIFGDGAPRDLAAINKTCRDINKAYHPDKNGGQTYQHLATINAAWDYMKRLLKD